MGAIIVTGIPGVGKTTVMEAAAKERNLKVVVYGTVMFEEAQRLKLVSHRDELRSLKPELQVRIQKAAAHAIAEMGDVIVDTHCSIKTPRGFLPGLPAWVLEALMPSRIILVEADAEEIRGRRVGDETRVRDADSVEEIEGHQEWNRRFSASYATLTGATVATVYNHNDKLDEAIQQILKVV